MAVTIDVGVDGASAPKVDLVDQPVDGCVHLFDPWQIRQHDLTAFTGAFDGQRAGAQEAFGERVVERDVVEPLKRDVTAVAGKDARPDDNTFRCHDITCRDPL